VNTPQTQLRVFVAVTPGLEPWLAAELADLGLAAKTTQGGAEVRATTENLWMLHHECRLAEHIRVRLRSFRARHFDELIAAMQRLPWHAYLRADRAVDVHVTTHRSRLWHSEAVAERTRLAIARSLRVKGLTAGASGPGVQSVYVRITGDCVQPAIDASGEPLHRRGRRTFVGVAPLRETLAAALVRMLAQAQSELPSRLWDPFCGSGSILLEWAESKLRLAAGRDRHFAFESWPIHDAAAYAAWLGLRDHEAAIPLSSFGSDVDAQVLAAAKANAERCPPTQCNWHRGDFEAFAESVPQATPIVTNPPYGLRLGDRNSAAQLMQRFELLLKRRTDLRPVVVLLPDPARPWQPRLEWERVARFHNGGVRVQVLRLADARQSTQHLQRCVLDPPGATQNET